MAKLTVWSGGQTGADQAALRAAKAAGLPTGGWAPKGWLTEDGPAPWLADYGLREAPNSDYRTRTKMNVGGCHGCLWFGNPHSPGGRLTLGLCASAAFVPQYVVLWQQSVPKDVADWVFGHLIDGEPDDAPAVLLVAGNRESGSVGIGAKTEAFLREVFAALEEG